MSEWKSTINVAIGSIGLVVAALLFRSGGVSIDGTPAPTPATSLAGLVDTEAATQLAAFYRDFSAVVAAGGCTSTGEFREAQQIAVKTLQTTLGKSGWSAVNEGINGRLVSAVGLEDRQLDEDVRPKLTAALTAISKEFGG